MTSLEKWTAAHPVRRMSDLALHPERSHAKFVVFHRRKPSWRALYEGPLVIPPEPHLPVKCSLGAFRRFFKRNMGPFAGDMLPIPRLDWRRDQ